MVESRLTRARAALGRWGASKQLARTGVLAILLVVAFLVLVGLNVLLRSGLWGDLLFAVAITTGALLGASRLLRPLLLRGDLQPPGPRRALLASVFLLVGVPLALVRLPWGPVLLFSGLILWVAVAVVLKLTGSSRSMPHPWTGGLLGLAVLLAVVFLAPRVAPADQVPGAVPEARLDAADIAVAELVRPLLFLDRGELRYPLDIEDAIAGGRVSQCYEGVAGCDVLERPQEIDTGYDYLRFAEGPAPPKGGDDSSGYYYRVVRPADGRVYVDYWWFFARNPSPVGEDVFCAPGLRTPPFTCQEHESDWEGVTVVLEPCTGGPDCLDAAGERLRPEAVRYAQHEHVVTYSLAETLLPLWETLRPPWAGLGGPRPLVFVARDSHASYPTPCERNCRQTTRDLPESRHDGSIVWTHNASCDGCLRPLPETAAGEPALWNAFPGPWGTQNCILAGAYCDLSRAPEAPARQGRYRDPAREGPSMCLRAGTTALERCPESA
ncbi:MAG TPA: hypothetical protein VK915_11395 [Gaiellaceae bacterium]|nr:hypothetical protein [Gaiellaceae bacterium]